MICGHCGKKVRLVYMDDDLRNAITVEAFSSNHGGTFKLHLCQAWQKEKIKVDDKIQATPLSKRQKGIIVNTLLGKYYMSHGRYRSELANLIKYISRKF